jgi:hypothetical protein
MKKILLTFFAILASAVMFAQTVYQIQYSTDAAGGYPSLYATQVVTTQGTVVGNLYYFCRSKIGFLPSGWCRSMERNLCLCRCYRCRNISNLCHWRFSEC